MKISTHQECKVLCKNQRLETEIHFKPLRHIREEGQTVSARMNLSFSAQAVNQAVVFKVTMSSSLQSCERTRLDPAHCMCAPCNAGVRAICWE